MKKHIKHLFVILLFFSCITTYSQICPPDPDGWTTNCNGEQPGQGNGTRSTPINDYAPLLIITAITIAGLISYKQRELLKK